MLYYEAGSFDLNLQVAKEKNVEKVNMLKILNSKFFIIWDQKKLLSRCVYNINFWIHVVAFFIFDIQNHKLEDFQAFIFIYFCYFFEQPEDAQAMFGSWKILGKKKNASKNDFLVFCCTMENIKKIKYY